jgi:hypothetical protein
MLDDRSQSGLDGGGYSSRMYRRVTSSPVPELFAVLALIGAVLTISLGSGADTPVESTAPTWIMYAICAVLLVSTVVYTVEVLFVRSNDWFSCCIGTLAAWFVIPGSVAYAASPSSGFSTRQWLSTAWYWALEPLPLDFAT